MMMYNGMLGGYGVLFMGIYLAGIVYFFYLLSGIAKSLTEISRKMDKISCADQDIKDRGGAL